MAKESASSLREFLCDIKCYDLVPISSKVLVCDMDISIQMAFFAFAEHGELARVEFRCHSHPLHCPLTALVAGMFAAALWDSRNGCFSGMLTSSDFVHLLHTYRHGPKAVEALSTHTIRSWRGTAHTHPAAPLARRTPPRTPHTEAAQALRQGTTPSQGAALKEGDLGVTHSATSDTSVSASASAAIAQAHSAGGQQGAMAHVADGAGGPVGGGRLICVSPEDSLLDACSVFHQYGIHRLPVVYEPQQSVLAILTHRAVLKHVVEFFSPAQDATVAAGTTAAALETGFFPRSAHKLGIGTYSNMVTLPSSTVLSQVLDTMATHNVSAIPLTDSEGVVRDIFTREDTLVLALDETLAALTASASAFKAGQQDLMRGNTELVTVPRSTTMAQLLELFGTTGAHRVVEVDAAGRCSGIISLSDVFGYVLGSLHGRVARRRRASSLSSGASSVPGSPAVRVDAPAEAVSLQASAASEEHDVELA